MVQNTLVLSLQCAPNLMFSVVGYLIYDHIHYENHLSTSILAFDITLNSSFRKHHLQFCLCEILPFLFRWKNAFLQHALLEMLLKIVVNCFFDAAFLSLQKSVNYTKQILKMQAIKCIKFRTRTNSFVKLLLHT